jgi:hypothetical protein
MGEAATPAATTRAAVSAPVAVAGEVSVAAAEVAWAVVAVAAGVAVTAAGSAGLPRFHRGIFWRLRKVSLRGCMSPFSSLNP